MLLGGLQVLTTHNIEMLSNTWLKELRQNGVTSKQVESLEARKIQAEAMKAKDERLKMEVELLK